MKGKIFEIKRFAVHDGDGIRTTVFFKGCPLKCVWCHNPEGIGFHPEIAYTADRCIGCGDCVSQCAHGAHHLQGGVHLFEREKCIACGSCAGACAGNALKFYGRKFAAEELISLILEDREFYETSGGGVTLSGGECLMQADFCAELLKQLKEEGIRTAVDTCGFVPWKKLEKVLLYTDAFLYDLKAFDEEVHIACTGQSNRIILENLRELDKHGKKFEIRIPFVPGFNEDQILPIADFVSGLENVTGVRVLPYHNFAGSKYGALDMENTLPPILPTEHEIALVKKMLREKGIRVI